jgi:hypothetical protein
MAMSLRFPSATAESPEVDNAKLVSVLRVIVFGFFSCSLQTEEHDGLYRYRDAPDRYRLYHSDTGMDLTKSLKSDEKVFSKKLQRAGMASLMARGGKVRELQRLRRRVERRTENVA